MRLPVVILPLIAAALFGQDLVASAQSAKSYPWCAIFYEDGGGTPRCYFDTCDQCMETISRIGDLCVENLQYSHRVQPGGRKPRS